MKWVTSCVWYTGQANRGQAIKKILRKKTNWNHRISSSRKKTDVYSVYIVELERREVVFKRRSWLEKNALHDRFFFASERKPETVKVLTSIYVYSCVKREKRNWWSWLWWWWWWCENIQVTLVAIQYTLYYQVFLKKASFLLPPSPPPLLPPPPPTMLFYW